MKIIHNQIIVEQNVNDKDYKDSILTTNIDDSTVMGRRVLVFILLQFSIFLGFCGMAVAEDRFLFARCGTFGNYTRSSKYRYNLDEALSSLTQSNNGYGFFRSSIGLDDGPDVANAIALCRGDLDPYNCIRCVGNAAGGLRQACINQRAATITYDTCLVSYSNNTLFETMNNRCAYKPVNVSNWAQFNQTAVNLFERLRGEAAKGDEYRKYASGNTTGLGSVGDIYGSVQCMPNFSETQCDSCLVKAVNDLVMKCSLGKGGGTYYKKRCIVRYDTSLFYNLTWYPQRLLAPLPSPPVRPLSTRQSSGKNKKSLMVFVAPILAASGLAIFIFLIWLKIRLIRKRKDNFLDETNQDTEDMCCFKLSAIQDATNNFSESKKLGEGGFGPVYSGELPEGKKIAVKRLSQNSGQGLEEFKTEVKLIIKLQHKNLVKLLGYCIQGNERLLVYEYMLNTSLDAFLFNPAKSKQLGWDTRTKIICGIAKGLQYLHEDSRLKIIHRDLKPSNVLLDADMNPKISDFGTARIFGANQVEANTNKVVGTYGYMAPEYAMDGLFSTKSDVYSFGVLLLEIISGQRNDRFFYEKHEQNLLSYSWHMWRKSKGEKLIDENIIDNCVASEALRLINTALLCIQEQPKDRPTMSSVVFMLEGGWTSIAEPSEPEPALSFSNTYISITSSQTTIGKQSCSSTNSNT